MRLIKLAIQKLTQTRQTISTIAKAVMSEATMAKAVMPESLSSQAIANTRMAEVTIKKVDRGGVKYSSLKLSDFAEIRKNGGMSKGELGDFLDRLLKETEKTFVSASSIKDVSKTKNNQNARRFFRSINAIGQLGGEQNSVIKISTNNRGIQYTRFFNSKTGELLNERTLFKDLNGSKYLRLSEQEFLQVDKNADGTHLYRRFKEPDFFDMFQSKKNKS